MKKDMIFPVIVTIISAYMAVFATDRGDLLIAAFFLIVAMVLSGLIIGLIILRKLIQLEGE